MFLINAEELMDFCKDGVQWLMTCARLVATSMHDAAHEQDDEVGSERDEDNESEVESVIE